MDIKTGLSIYNKQWLIEHGAALQMLDFWENVKAGEAKWSYQEAKGEKRLSVYNIYQQFFSTERVMMAPDNSYDMPDFKGFDGATVAVIPVTGPLMKSDFCGSFGTSTLKQLTQMASNTPSVKTIVFAIDSPGGTVDGTQAFADTIKASPKRTVAFVDGMMCSAAYWIGSSANEIYAGSNTDIIGSIGTMCAFYDNAKALESRGVVLRAYYATDSKDKNAAMSEAANGDGKKLIAETLDPINNTFLSAVRDNRAGKIDTNKENVLTGKTYTADNAKKVGLIDGIASFEQVIKSSIKSTKNKMTAAELKAAHPEAYAEIKALGAAEERDRVGSWMAFLEVDPKAVKAGVDSGKDISKTQMSDFALKAHSKTSMEELEEESKGNQAQTKTPATPEAKEEEDLKAFNAKVKENLKNFKY